jgi:hypothetical protein
MNSRACRDFHRTFGAPLTHQQQPYAFQQFSRLVHTLGQKQIGLRVAFIDLDASGNKNCRSLRGNFFDLMDHMRAVQARHYEIGDDEINPAALKCLQRLLAVVAGHYAIAASFEQNFSYGKGLFVVVDAENRLLGLHEGIGESALRQNLSIKFFENRERCAC